MSKRLQVLLKDAEYREIQRMARSHHMSIAEWVRQALDLARRRESVGDVGKKLAAIRAAAQHQGRRRRTSTSCWQKPSGGVERWAHVILVDSNIPIYLVGGPHPHKRDAQRIPEVLADSLSGWLKARRVNAVFLGSIAIAETVSCASYPGSGPWPKCTAAVR
jgi:hypothetical protein